MTPILTYDEFAKIWKRISMTRGVTTFNYEFNNDKQAQMLDSIEAKIVENQLVAKDVGLLSKILYAIVQSSKYDSVKNMSIAHFHLLYETSIVKESDGVAEQCAIILMNITIDPKLNGVRDRCHHIWCQLLKAKNPVSRTMATIYALDTKSNPQYCVLASGDPFSNAQHQYVYKNALRLLQSNKSAYPRINSSLDPIPSKEILKRILNQYWYGKLGVEGIVDHSERFIETIKVTIDELSMVEDISEHTQWVTQIAKGLAKTMEETGKILERQLYHNQPIAGVLNVIEVFETECEKLTLSAVRKIIDSPLQTLLEKTN